MAEATSIQFTMLMQAYLNRDKSPSFEEFAKIYQEFKKNIAENANNYDAFVKKQCETENNGINCESESPVEGEVEGDLGDKKPLEEGQTPVGGGKSKKTSKKRRKHKKRVSKKTK